MSQRSAIATVIAGVVDETRDEEFRLRPRQKISADRGAIVDPGEPDTGMRTQRPDNDRKFEVSRKVRKPRIRLRQLRQLRPRRGRRHRDIQPFDSGQQTMQLVAVEIADEARRIEKRPRPTRGRAVDLAQRLAAWIGVGCNHDGDVMVGQRYRQFDPGHDIKRQQFDAGVFQQKLDRRVAAHIHRSRQRENAQLRLFRRTRRSKQLMKGEHFRLNRHSGRLVAQQLGDQRQIEPLACAGGSGGDLRHQLVAQRPKIGPAERHRRQPGKSDPVRAGIADQVVPLGALRRHAEAPRNSGHRYAPAATRSWRRWRRHGQVHAVNSRAPCPRRKTRSR